MRRRSQALLPTAVALAVAAMVVIVLGVDAAAEMPVSANRLVVLIAAALGGVFLFGNAALFVALHVQDMVFARRAEVREELRQALRSGGPSP